MQKIAHCLVLTFLFTFMLHSPAAGTQLGPATPSAGQDSGNIGIGYFYHEAEYEGVDIDQNRIYLHLGRGMGIGAEPVWEFYLRAGVADLEAQDFDSSYEPFGSVGLKGALWDGEIYGWGLALQGSYFYEFEDDDLNVSIEDYWEIEAGIPFQIRLNSVLLYAGPVFYHAEASAEGFGGTADLEEEDNVGAFGGIGISFGGFNIEAEAQYKSDFSAGGLVTIQF